QLDGAVDAVQLTDAAWGYGAPHVSPDGRHLALTRVDVDGSPAAGHLVFLDLADGSIRDLADELDRECLGGSIQWLDDSRAAVLVGGAGALRPVAFDILSGTHEGASGGR